MKTYAIKGEEKILVTSQNKNDLIGYKFILQDELDPLDKEVKRKGDEIQVELSPDDQLILLANCLEILAEQSTHPTIAYAKEKFAKIKNILNS